MWSRLWSRRCAVGLCIVVVMAAHAYGSGREEDSALAADAVHRLAARYDAFAAVPNDPQGRVVYGASRGHLHLIRHVGAHYREIWVSPSLGSRIQKVLIADLAGNGTYQIVAFNVRGTILVYDVNTFALLWQSQDQQFRSIEALTIADVDNDPQQELLFVSEGKLYIYDALHFIEEWRSDALFDAKDIVVGDVDGDGVNEIILGSGQVLDGHFRNLEWESTVPFGTHLELADIDGDGKLELIAGTNGTISIWDIDERREKWD